MNYNVSTKLIDHVYTIVYETPSINNAIGEGNLKDLEKNANRYEFYPLQYMVNGQWRNLLYFSSVLLEYENIHTFGFETVSIYDDTIRYMQGRKQVVVDESIVIPITLFKHYFELSDSPTYCLEYNIKTNYINLSHGYISSIIYTVHYNNTAIFNEYYTKNKTHYFLIIDINQSGVKLYNAMIFVYIYGINNSP